MYHNQQRFSLLIDPKPIDNYTSYSQLNLLLIFLKERYFPSAGEPGYIMIKQIDMGQEFSQMQNLVTRLSGESR